MLLIHAALEIKINKAFVDRRSVASIQSSFELYDGGDFSGSQILVSGPCRSKPAGLQNPTVSGELSAEISRRLPNAVGRLRDLQLRCIHKQGVPSIFANIDADGQDSWKERSRLAVMSGLASSMQKKRLDFVQKCLFVQQDCR